MADARTALGYLVGVVLCAIASGCGAYGRTRPFVLTGVKASVPQPLPAISVGLVEVDEHGLQEVAVDCVAIPAYGQQDLAALRRSLRDTLSRSPASASAGRWTLHLVLRRYLNAYSSTGGRILACAAWCIVDDSQAVLYQEQFYVQARGGLVVTIGAIKNRIHRSIVQRIVEKVLELHAHGAESARALVVGKTYDTFAAVPPDVLTTLQGRSAWGALDWNSGRCDAEMDWQAKLAGAAREAP
jgi:hypothetical protein